MSFVVIIPARYASTRLPGKPLADIGGKPMIVRVAERAKRSGARMVHIATDDARVASAAAEHGHSWVMTSADHATGTDRLAEAVRRLECVPSEIVVNVQGDEPLIDPSLIARVAGELARDPDVSIATAAHPIAEAEDFFNPNVVKVVCDERGRAAYFSRAPIPYARDAFAAGRSALPAGLPALRHIGLYAYRVRFLLKFQTLEQAPTERFEALEQLRALWHGYRIQVAVTEKAPAPGVDTAEDLALVRSLLKFDE